MTQVAIAGLIEKLTALGVIVLAFDLIHPALPVYLTGGLASGTLASSLYCALRIRHRYLRVASTSVGQLWALWKSSISFGIAGLASQLQRADVAIVAVTAGGVAAGLYGAPARITNALGIVPTSFSQVIFPEVARLGNHRRTYQAAGVAGGFIFVAMAFLLAVGFILAPAIVQLALGNQYAESSTVLRVILVGMVPASVNAPLSVILQAAKEEAFVGRAVSIASLVGLSAVAIGSRVDGAIGASYGFLILQLVVSAALLTRFVRVYKAAPAILAETT